MFSTIRTRLIASIGMRSVSLENLARFELDSIDSMPMSESTNASSLDSNSSRSIIDKLGLRRQASVSSSVDLCEYNPKEGVLKILRVIKQLKIAKPKELNLMTFLEMLQLQFYKNVSLTLLKDFMQCHKMMPKPVYFHYYIYFLHYAEYYHYTRGVVDIIDPTKKEFHNDCLENIRAQLKYVYRIINRPQTNEISL